MRLSTAMTAVAAAAALLANANVVHEASAVKIVVQTTFGADAACGAASRGVQQVMPVSPNGTCATYPRGDGAVDSLSVDCAAGTFKYYPGVAACAGTTTTRTLGASTCVNMNGYAQLACEEAQPTELMFGSSRLGPGCTNAVDRNLVFKIGMCTTVGDSYATFSVNNGIFYENRFSSYPCTGTPVNVTSGALGACNYNSKYNVSVSFQVGNPFPAQTVKAVVQTYYGNNDATCGGPRDYSRVLPVKPDGTCARYSMNGGTSSVQVDCAAGTFKLFDGVDACQGTPTASLPLGSCANFHPYARITCEDVDPASLLMGDVSDGLTCASKPPKEVLVYQAGRCSSVGTALAVFTPSGPDTWTQVLFPSYPCVTPLNSTAVTVKLGVCNPAPAYNVSVVFRNGTIFTLAPTSAPSSSTSVGASAAAILVASVVGIMAMVAFV